MNGTAKSEPEATRKTVASQLAANIPPSQSYQPAAPQQSKPLSMDTLQKNVQNMNLSQSTSQQQSTNQFASQPKAAYKSPSEIAPKETAKVSAQSTSTMSGLAATMNQLNAAAVTNPMNISPSAPVVNQNLIPGVGLASGAPSAAVGAPKPAGMAPPPPPPGVNIVNPNNQYMMNMPLVYYDVSLVPFCFDCWLIFD